MPRNPSEYMRIIEEYSALIDAILTKRPTGVGIYDKGMKASLQLMLDQLRPLEKQLGIDSKPYNSEEFKSSALSSLRKLGCI